MSAEEPVDPDATSGPNEGGTTVTRAMDPAETAGTVIGRYHLLQKIGEGGMGEVWLAEQKEPVRRRVALKLVKAGMNSREVIARFESERQALALMDHPAIAKVFDAGSTPQGAPYFVMEYVAGVPITTYCDNHRLNMRERLELFTHVCEGAQHAHQKAIIHRDLKPSNIIVTEVDGKAAPKIIDFGVAKALTQKLTADTMFTRVGALVGTPEYMSPEQALSSGEDIDTRTDVYSLGIVFYELLAGAPPIELRKIAFEEFLRRLREDDPPKPSTKIRTQDGATSTELAHKRRSEPPALAKLMRGDLDSIALKALEKDRTRRYGSPSDFAADIGRYLKNEAVLAVPPSATYRARKFARRYRAVLATACAFAVVLIVAAAVSIRQSIHAGREAAVAQAVNDFLQNDLLAQASAANQSGPRAKPDPHLEVHTALDRAAQRISGKFDKQPEVEASIRDTIGETYDDLGLYPEARKQLERALELQRRVLGPENPKTLSTLRFLGRVAVNQGHNSEAEALMSQSLEASRRVLGPENRATLATMQDLGYVYTVEAKYAQAEAVYSEAVKASRRVLGPESRGTLAAMSQLANLKRHQGKYAEAETLLSQVLEIDRRVLGPEDPETLTTSTDRGSAYIELGKYAQAEAVFLQALEIQRRILGPEHPATLTTMNRLAISYNEQGKYAQAEAMHSQVLEIQRRVLGPEHPNTLAAWGNLAYDYDRQGKHAQAEEIDRQNLEVHRRVLGPENPGTLTQMTNLAIVYAEQGKFAQAEPLFRQIMEIRRRVRGPENPATLESMSNLAELLRDIGKYAQAEALSSEALEIRRRVLGPEHPSTLKSMYGLADAYYVQGKYAQAEPMLEKVAEIRRRVLGPEHPDTLSALSALAAAYQRQGKYDTAETYAAQALAGLRHAQGAEAPDTVDAAARLALAYQSQGKFTQSEALMRQADAFDGKKRPDDWQRYDDESLLGASLAGQKKYREAEPLLLEGYRGMVERRDKMAVPDRSDIDRALEWIVQLYRAWGKPSQAAEWKKTWDSTKGRNPL